MNGFLSEVAAIQKKDRPEEASYCFIYRGPSMAPTFRPGQLLFVRSQTRAINPGDVIVFHGHDDRSSRVVHRVISVSPDGLITRGDNNLRDDPTPIGFDRVVGRVERANLRGQFRPVVGGWRGLWLARTLRAKLQIRTILRGGFREPYRWLRASRLVRYLWKPSFSKVWLAGEDGPWVKFVHRGRTVARWWPKRNQFECRKPYDLVLRREDFINKDVTPGKKPGPPPGF